jgi:hypothetical protein
MTRCGTVLIPHGLDPTVSFCVDLPPFIEEVRRTENGRQASKRLPHFARGSGTEVEDKDSWAVKERKSPFIEEITIARQQHKPMLESVCGMTFVWMSCQAHVLCSSDSSSHRPQQRDGLRRKVLVRIEPCLGATGEIIQNLLSFSPELWAKVGDGMKG